MIPASPPFIVPDRLSPPVIRSQHSLIVYNTNEIGSIVISATQGADASSISGKSNSVDNEAAASIGELENGGNLGVVLDNGIIGEDFTTSDKGTYSNYGIENEKGGVISSIEGSGKIVGNSVAVDNKGLIVDVSGTAKIEGLGSASYGIVNDGEIDGIQLSSSGQISGVVASIRNNENATIGTSLSGSIGITNDGNMGEIDNYGTIEGSTYGIDNKGVLAGITGGESLSGTIKGGEAGIYNEKGGTLKEITNEKTIEGMGDGSYGIDNAGEMTSNLVIVSGEDISGTSYSIENSGDIFEIDNEGTLSSLENSGTIGNAENESSSYGIENAGTINEITNEAKGTIEGSVDSINNETGAQIGMSGTTGISNAGHIQTIENQGTIGVSGSVGIENTGEITTVNNIIGGEIEGEIENEVSSTNAATGSTGINLISNAGTISADLTNGGNIVSLENKANGNIQGTILNTGTISGIENYSIINTLTNEGTLGSATQGIDNGANATINDGGSSSLEGTIEGTEAGINNESGGSLSLGAQKAIEGTGNSDATSKEYGIENAGQITDILSIEKGETIKGTTNAIENQGTIGVSGSVGIENTGEITTVNNIIGGEIEGEIEKGETIKGTTNAIENQGTIGVSGSGKIVGNSVAVDNKGLIVDVSGTAKIEGLGSASYGIVNAGEMTSNLVIVSGEDISGTSYSIENSGDIFEIDNEGTLSSLENSGTIGNAENESSSYGIENAGTINEITNEAKGTIEGSVDSINNETGAQIGMSGTTGISNAGHIQTIENQGTIGVSGSVGIENTGEITTVNNIIGGEIEGEIENEVSSTNAATGSTGINLISNAGTISADLTNGGNIVSLENKANGNIQGTILNTGTISGIENYSIINTLTNEGTLGSATQGIDNGANATINDLTNEGGGLITLITNESSGTIDNLTNTESNSSGTTKVSTIDEINNGGSLGTFIVPPCSFIIPY